MRNIDFINKTETIQKKIKSKSKDFNECIQRVKNNESKEKPMDKNEFTELLYYLYQKKQ